MGAEIIKFSIDSFGILSLVFDDSTRRMNVLSSAAIEQLDGAIIAAAADDRVKGILIQSGKSSFAAGADLHEIVDLFDHDLTLTQGFALSQKLSCILRRLETMGKPVAVAINGAALGGGFELCLAAHFRVLSNHPTALIGLPEVKVGLLPGAGGTQRIPRLIGVAAALPLIIEGMSLQPQQALKLGLVHEVLAPDLVVPRARAWLLSSPEPIQPWNRKGFELPGGSVTNPAVAQVFVSSTARVAKDTQRNYPAPIAILSAVFEGCSVGIDAALKIESSYFAKLVTNPVAGNLIRTLFLAKKAADKLAYRPTHVPPGRVRKIGVVGAGMMGAGIAHVSAEAGIQAVLLDSTRELADKGKSRSGQLLEREIERGHSTAERAREILNSIKTTTEYCELRDCDLLIEAVFEQRSVKEEVLRKIEAVCDPGATVASNTSTLPISSLAASLRAPARFVGMHFFSPVERMPLVEIIVGQNTSQETVAKAMDYVAQIRKTPIVVNDSRGFFTSRVFSTFTAEGMKLLEEGVDPALIENGAVAAGMPVGPLAVSDEVSLELQYQVLLQSERDLGAEFVAPIHYPILKKFVLELDRKGKRARHGFYAYPDAGKKYLWHGLSEVYPRSATQPSLASLKRRFLHIQALESARCLEEGVISRASDGDLASILGVGFPAYTGGTLSYIDTVGIATFVSECSQMSHDYGARFMPSPWLVDRAAAGFRFHEARAGTKPQR